MKEADVRLVAEKTIDVVVEDLQNNLVIAHSKLEEARRIQDEFDIGYYTGVTDTIEDLLDALGKKND